MFCPSCSTPSAEGAKFCKACGMSLTVITHALSGGLAYSDPIRDREYKRARRQITDGIRGACIGAAFLVVSIAAYLLLPRDRFAYVISLGLALVGIIKLFKSLGNVIDAKVGQKLLDPTLQPRPSGSLVGSQPLPPIPTSPRLNQKSLAEPAKAQTSRPPVPAGEMPAQAATGDPQPAPVARMATGRVNREQSIPIGKQDKDDLMSKLRN